MNEKPITLTRDDSARLNLLLASVPSTHPAAARDSALRGELDRATLVTTKPTGVAGLFSKVDVLDLDSSETETFTLTFPEHADVSAGRLSVLTPLGTALLGFAEGDEIKWKMPGGVRRLRLTRVVDSAEMNVPLQR